MQTREDESKFGSKAREPGVHDVQIVCVGVARQSRCSLSSESMDESRTRAEWCEDGTTSTTAHERCETSYGSGIDERGALRVPLHRCRKIGRSMEMISIEFGLESGKLMRRTRL